MAHFTKKQFRRHPTNPKFFQPLLPDFQTNFSIPKSFCKYVELVGGDEIDDDNVSIEVTVTLRARKGKVYKVKVVLGDDHKQHFRDGWNQFCKEHDLHVGDFVVFKLQANLVFDVSIYDPITACEREFPGFDADRLAKMEVSSSWIRRDGCQRGIGGKEHWRRKVDLKSSGRPYFHTVVKPYNLMKTTVGIMYIPLDFATENGLRKRRCKMELIDETGQSWSTLLRYWSRKGGITIPYISGWYKIHRANTLNIGDHLIFELLSSGTCPVMKFYGLKRMRSVNCSKKKVAFKPRGYPYCRMVVQSDWAILSAMCFPRDFTRVNNLASRRCRIVLLDEKGRSWYMQLRPDNSNKNMAYIGGWRSFHEANAINAGDHVVLELVQSGKKPCIKFYS